MSSPNSKGPCRQRACESRTNQTDNPNAEMSGKPLLYTGVLWIHVMRRFLLPRRDEPCDFLPPSEDSKPLNISQVSSNAAFEQVQVHRNPLQPTIPLVSTNEATPEDKITLKQREPIQNRHSHMAELLNQVKDRACQVNGVVNDFIAETKAVTAETVNVIRQEDAVIFRYGVITVSGFVGYLLGLRRGTLPRLLYSATGAAAAAAICYPRESVHHNQQVLDMVHKFVVLGIEFGRKQPNKSIGTTSSKTNDLRSDSKKSESEVKRQPTKLTNESFISPENDFKHYKNYYEAGRHKQKSDTLQSHEKVEKLKENGTSLETDHTAKISNLSPNDKVEKTNEIIIDSSTQQHKPHISKSTKELVISQITTAEETTRKIDNAAEVSPLSEQSQGAFPEEILYPPLHNNSVHRSNISTEKFELKQKDSIASTTPELQGQNEITPENPGSFIKETVPDCNIHNKCVIRNDIQTEDLDTSILVDEYVPLNRKLSRYYKNKNQDNSTILTGADEDSNARRS